MTTETLMDSAEAEAQLIGLCLMGLALPSELPAMTVGCWANRLNAEAWDTVRRIHAEGGRVPTASQVVSRIGGDARELGSKELAKHFERCVALAPIVSQRALPLAIEEHAHAVRRFAGKRAIKRVADDLNLLADDPLLSAQDALASVDKELESIRTGAVLSLTTLRTLTMQMAGDLDKPSKVMPTGIDGLNTAMAGGIWAGKLYGIAARMKVGKTVTLATVARNAARAGHKVLYIALEMGQMQVAQRVVADRLGVNSVQFLKRDDQTLPERLVGYAMRNDAPELDNLMFKDWPGCTFDQLKGLCYAAAAHHGIELIVLDYWQLIQGAAKGATETQHLATVAQWLADFAGRSGVAILTAAQINRDGQTRGSDGLRLACDWYSHLHPANPNQDRDRWLEVLDSRYTIRIDVGSESRGEFFIDNVGPVLREYR